MSKPDPLMADRHTNGSHTPQSQLTAQLQQELPSSCEIRVDPIDHSSSTSAAESSKALSVASIIPRPWSSHKTTRSKLSPSPAFVEKSTTSKDDFYALPSPITPRRSTFSSRGLSLQMPPRDVSSTSTANLTKCIPQSPKVESPTSYTYPASALPRRSRGMDFSRACTNLHHSTLAESSPDSSPTVGGRGMMIPPRKGLFNSLSTHGVPESPSSASHTIWSTMPHLEKGLSSSIGSSSMMDYNSGSSSSDDNAMEGEEDEEYTIHSTTQAPILGSGSMNAFGIHGPILGGDAVGGFAVPAARLMSYQRARLHKGRSRKSSSSASGHGSINSPGPSSPPLLRSIESGHNPGYFFKDPLKKEIDSRRESLSLGTTELQLSDFDESDEGRVHRGNLHESAMVPTPLTPTMDERRSVIRKAVTRRGNLLPKSKNFARIKAALLEEGAPVDTEVRREAEVIRQVRENDGDADLSLQPASQPTTTASSPSLLPTAGQPDCLEDIPEDVTMRSESASRRSSSAFSYQASRNSTGPGFWNQLDDRRMRTPPPLLVPRGSSSGVSDDISMDTPMSSIQSITPHQVPNKQFHASESLPSLPLQTSTLTDPPRKGNKRIREDDFDPHYFKRRAVSPGMSLQNSPVLPQSPQGGWWTQMSKSTRESPHAQVLGERVSSGGSSSSAGAPSGTPKRIGLQGMTDTHDAIMKMNLDEH